MRMNQGEDQEGDNDGTEKKLKNTKPKQNEIKQACRYINMILYSNYGKDW